MRNLPKIDVLLTVALSLLFVGLGFGYSPALADCCTKEPVQTTTKVVIEKTCCLPEACCCEPAKAPVEKTETVASFYNLRREVSTSTVGLSATSSSTTIDDQRKSKSDFLVVKPEPVRAKLFILFRSLLI